MHCSSFINQNDGRNGGTSAEVKVSWSWSENPVEFPIIVNQTCIIYGNKSSGMCFDLDTLINSHISYSFVYISPVVLAQCRTKNLAIRVYFYNYQHGHVYNRTEGASYQQIQINVIGDQKGNFERNVH
jgi:hypothetical protein